MDPGATGGSRGHRWIQGPQLDPGAQVDPGATAVDPGATAVDPGATAVDPGATAGLSSPVEVHLDWKES